MKTAFIITLASRDTSSSLSSAISGALEGQPMNDKPRRQLNIQKAANTAIVVNMMEITVLACFMLYLAVTDLSPGNKLMVQALAFVGALMASWGALLDIREALQTRRRAQKIEDLTVSNSQMEQLNNTLRMQRHDFLNHLQVVYSLLEMQEYVEATDYLEKVYGDIRAVSTVLRTRSTAVNALLKVKAGAFEERRIPLEMDIRSSLEGLSMPSWELCRVLSNLLDNAMDAVKNESAPKVAIRITENLRQFVFRVENNGPAIPGPMIQHIFEPGVTTKSEGHGMGLYIIRQTLTPYGG
ncbi:MAG: GHKL domain-containing protein, partial [Clostridia bacterium]|nr:GHKL domain-containing protein [Clostridia bacterium]